MEFLDDVIKCYAKQTIDDELIYYPLLDVPRGATFKAQNAMMIVGKGYMSPDYINPDFDNDAAEVYGDDMLRMDNAIYETLGTYQCGDPNTVYLDSDLNADCDVNKTDLSVLAGQWLYCSDPTNTDCDQYWKTNTYFVDEFDQASLDPRWEHDNSAANSDLTGGGAIVMASGRAQAVPTHQEAYNHIQTPINAEGNFTVQAKLRCSRANGGNDGGLTGLLG